MKQNGKTLPAHTGPSPEWANEVSAGMVMDGWARSSPTASMVTVPIFTKVER